MKRTIKVLACALLLTGVISCQEKQAIDEDKKPVKENRPVIELLEEENSSIMLPAATTEAFSIGIKANFPVAELEIITKKGEDWCTAEFDGEDAIKFTPSKDGITETKRALFCITKKTEAAESENIIIPEDVNISISRGAAEIKNKGTVSFVKDADKDYKMKAGNVEPAFIDIRPGFPVEELVIRTISGEDWCTAEFNGEKQIKITPSKDFLLEQKTAKFVVESKEAQTKATIIFNPKPVEFTVSREAMTVVEKEVIMFPRDGHEMNIGINQTSPVDYLATYLFNIEDITVEQVDVEGEEKGWVSIEMFENRITVTPCTDRTEREMKATFVFKSDKDKIEGNTIYRPKDVTIKIIRPKYIKEFTIEISGAGIEYSSPKNYLATVKTEGAVLEITVNTNAPTWYYNEMGGELEWCTPSFKYGDNGQVLKVTIDANDTGMPRYANILFTTLPGEYNGTLLQVMQLN